MRPFFGFFGIAAVYDLLRGANISHNIYFEPALVYDVRDCHEIISEGAVFFLCGLSASRILEGKISVLSIAVRIYTFFPGSVLIAKISSLHDMHIAVPKPPPGVELPLMLRFIEHDSSDQLI